MGLAHALYAISDGVVEFIRFLLAALSETRVGPGSVAPDAGGLPASTALPQLSSLAGVDGDLIGGSATAVAGDL